MTGKASPAGQRGMARLDLVIGIVLGIVIGLAVAFLLIVVVAGELDDSTIDTPGPTRTEPSPQGPPQPPARRR